MVSLASDNSKNNFIVENGKYLLAALVLHVVLGMALVVTMDATRQTVEPQLAIKAVVVDHSLQRLRREREAAERQAREQAELERQARERAEAEAKREQERREQESVAALRAEEQRKQEAKRMAQRQAEEKRLADIRAKQAEKQRSEREAREQAEREAELKRQLAEEEGRMQAENAGLLNQYAALIEQRVVRNWNKPASARPGIQCEVKVTQAPGGTVLSVQIGQCNGDQAVRQSIEAAVHRSSPLPPPPDARLFQRNIVFVFKPTE